MHSHKTNLLNYIICPLRFNSLIPHYGGEHARSILRACYLRIGLIAWWFVTQYYAFWAGNIQVQLGDSLFALPSQNGINCIKAKSILLS